MSPRETTNNSRSLTLDRGVRVLKLLSASDERFTVGTIATNLGLHRQVVYRLLGTLEEHGLAARTQDGRWGIGFATVALAGGWAEQVESALRPLLLDLAEASSATAFLMSQEGDEAVAMLVEEPRSTLFHLAFRPGSRHPLTHGAGGIAILAARAESPDDSESVRNTRASGIAVSREQVTPGALGVAAPVSLFGLTTLMSIGVIAMLEGADVDHLIGHVTRVAEMCASLGPVGPSDES